METCVGCGSPLAPTWKYCIHCGLAAREPDDADASGADNLQPSRATMSRMLVLIGVGIFIVGVALLVVAIAFFAGAFR